MRLSDSEVAALAYVCIKLTAECLQKGGESEITLAGCYHQRALTPLAAVKAQLRLKRGRSALTLAAAKG